MDEKTLVLRSEERLKTVMTRLLHFYSEKEGQMFSSPIFSTLFTAIRRAERSHEDLLKMGDFLSLIPLMVADSLELILDEMGHVVGDQKLKGESLFKAVEPILKKHLEGEQSLCQQLSLLKSLRSKKTSALFSGLLSDEDLEKWHKQKIEQLVQNMEAEVHHFLKSHEDPEIRKLQSQLIDLGWEAKAKVFCELILPKIEEIG